MKDSVGGVLARGSVPGWRTWGLATVAYVAVAVIATWPRAATITTEVPWLSDPMTHLWTMRYYKTCLLEWRSPFVHDGIQAPVGAPLGLVPPLHLQTLAYLALSAFTANDVLCYNIIWFATLVVAGLGAFSLAWYLLRDRACAWFAGLATMLSGPVMLHAHGHLELMHVGMFPIFLVAWMRLVDRPGLGRLAMAAAMYLLTAMSAPYFMVFAIFPAALYTTWRVAAVTRVDGLRAAVMGRLGWLLAFVAVVVPAGIVLFSGQIWAMVDGHGVERPRSEFERYGAPLWSYTAPVPMHAASRLLPFDPYQKAGIDGSVIEQASYLGLAVLGLVAYAAWARVRFARAGFIWLGLAMVLVLSLGAYWTLGGRRIELPSSWLLAWFPPFRLLRVPARFNLYTAIFASVVAAAGLRHLLGQVGEPWARGATFVALVALVVGDLAMVPFRSIPVPAMPGCYAALTRNDPRASFVEVPSIESGHPFPMSVMCAYWQSFHRGRTTAGYGAHSNFGFDAKVAENSPFQLIDLANPYYLATPDDIACGPLAHVNFRDYAWLFLTVNDLRYVVVHHWPGQGEPIPVHLDRLEALFADVKVFEDGATVAYDRDRLPRPSHPTAICGEGWRTKSFSLRRPFRPLDRRATLTVYNPDPAVPLSLDLGASGFNASRSVRVLDPTGTEVAAFRFPADQFATQSSGPFQMPAGLSTLTFEVDGESAPTRPRDQPREGDRRPFSLRVYEVALRPANGLRRDPD